MLAHAEDGGQYSTDEQMVATNYMSERIEKTL
jgi:hypothetical protein